MILHNHGIYIIIYILKKHKIGIYGWMLIFKIKIFHKKLKCNIFLLKIKIIDLI